MLDEKISFLIELKYGISVDKGVKSVYSFDRDEIENTSIGAHVAIDQPPSILISKQSSMSQSGGMPRSESEASERVCCSIDKPFA